MLDSSQIDALPVLLKFASTQSGDVTADVMKAACIEIESRRSTMKSVAMDIDDIVSVLHYSQLKQTLKEAVRMLEAEIDFSE